MLPAGKPKVETMRAISHADIGLLRHFLSAASSCQVSAVPDVGHSGESVDRNDVRFRQRRIDMSPMFQIVTWSLFGVLLIAYIGVKMSKRRRQS
jgi:hypothetical protein